MPTATEVAADFRVTVASVRGRTIVRVSGEVDVATAPLLRHAIAGAQAGVLRAVPRVPVIVDLSEVTFLDACALGVLAAAASRARRAGTNVVLRNPSRMTLRLLGITGLIPRFRIEREDCRDATATPA